MKKITLLFSIAVFIVLIFVIVFIIKKTEQTKEMGKSFYQNFNVKVSGIVIQKEDMGHGYAKIKLSIRESNTASYYDTIHKGYPYCIIEDDIATFIGPFNRKVFLDDSVKIGPNDSIIVYTKQ